MQLAENVVVAGKFRLNHLLGRGGMGSVWHATHLALDIPCAVKFIEGDFAAVPEMQARFQREAKAAAALRSPHVVQILDHDIWEGMPFIAMELLDGEELSKRLGRVGPLPPGEVNAILSQVCRALGKAHQYGIVHRDLKPDNLFLVRDDDREIVKILDFGIAKSKNPNLDIGGNTKTGAMLGTPYYMSPEQAQGTKSIDGRADLWALGVIAFECMTGTRPFESDALGDLLMQIMVKPLPMPSQVRPGLPPGFDGWFAKACARDPKDRFQTAKELSDGLARSIGQGVSTEVMSPKEVNAAIRGATLPLHTPNPLNTPNPMLGSAPGMAPVGPVTGGVAAPTPFAHEAQIPLPQKTSPLVFVAVGVVALAVLGGGLTFALTRKGGGDTSATPTHTSAPTETAPAQAATAATTATVAATATVSATVTAQPAETAASGTAAAGGGAHVTTPHAVGPKPSAHPSAQAGTPKNPGGGGHDLGF